MKLRDRATAPRKSEVIGVRLDPKQRYLAEVAARQHRQSLSGFIDWAIQKALAQVELGPKSETVAEKASVLWDVDEPDRLAKLAFNYPHLLSYEEQVIWKMVTEDPEYWTPESTLEEIIGRGDSSGKVTHVPEAGVLDLRKLGMEERILDAAHLQWNVLRAKWPMLVAAARGEAPRKSTPGPSQPGRTRAAKRGL